MIKLQARRVIIMKECQTRIDQERGCLCCAEMNRIRSAQAVRRVVSYRITAPQAISPNNSTLRESRYMHHWINGGAEMSCTELITGSVDLNMRRSPTRLVSVM